MGKRFLPGVDIAKTSEALPSVWSHTPADEALVKAWEEATVQRPKATETLMKKYGSLYGALCCTRPSIGPRSSRPWGSSAQASS
eukprot:2476497-Prymnesium_polylepis.1